MKSRITVEIDFNDQNRPCIKMQVSESNDVRDKIARNFTDALRGDSMWCTIVCDGGGSDLETGAHTTWIIKPVTPDEIQDEMSKMRDVLPPVKTP